MNLNDLIKEGYKIFIDISSILCPGSNIFLNFGFCDLSNNDKIFMPSIIYNDIIKKNLSCDTQYNMIKINYNMINSLIKNQVIEIRGENDDPPLHEIFPTIFTLYRTDYNLALITQDIEIAKKIYNLARAQSVRSKKIIVVRINEKGNLEKIENEYANVSNIPKVAFKNSTSVLNPKIIQPIKKDIIAKCSICNQEVILTSVIYKKITEKNEKIYCHSCMNYDEIVRCAICDETFKIKSIEKEKLIMKKIKLKCKRCIKYD